MKAYCSLKIGEIERSKLIIEDFLIKYPKEYYFMEL